MAQADTLTAMRRTVANLRTHPSGGWSNGTAAAIIELWANDLDKPCTPVASANHIKISEIYK